jgi:hypothetical protein
MKTSPDYMKETKEGIPDKMPYLMNRMQRMSKLLILMPILMQS